VEHWDGTSWQVLPNQQGGYVSGVALAANDIWAVGTSIAHYVGGLCFPGNMQIRTVQARIAIAELAYDSGTGHLFAANYDGSVSIRDPKQATVLRTIPVGGFVENDDGGGGVILQRMVLDSAERRVIVVDPGSDQVTMLDTSLGSILHTTSVGPRPSKRSPGGTAPQALRGQSWPREWYL
jgi:DNA-binding beta-propeller fold protein YncE